MRPLPPAMCGHCLLRNRDQEIKRVLQIVDAHQHVPGKLRGYMCVKCTHGSNDPQRHD